jgi:hypothetical protein
MQASELDSDPRHHAANVSRMLGDLVQHLRSDIRQFSEPKAQALFGTGAEVLLGLQTAFDHYQGGKEPGMRR